MSSPEPQFGLRCRLRVLDQQIEGRADGRSPWLGRQRAVRGRRPRKLFDYIAAGSIQGTGLVRFDRRVEHRRSLLILAALLMALIWALFRG